MLKIVKALLLNFESVRTTKQALSFYVAWFFLVFAIVGPVLGIVIMNTSEPIQGDSYEEIFRLANTIGIPIVTVICTALSIMIARAKRLLRNPYTLLFIFLTIILSLWGGVVFGLIIPARLTVKRPE